MSTESSPHFTPRVKTALVCARRFASQHKLDYVGTSEMLLGLLVLDSGPHVSLLAKLGVNASDLAAKYAAAYDELFSVPCEHVTGNRFCPKCGARLTEDEPIPPPPK
jgi:ATP-dependent Clp protease ATP-binding subunit ClpA